MITTATTAGGIGVLHRRAGDGWWAAAAIVLIGAVLAVILALTLGPVEHPLGPAGDPGAVEQVTAHDSPVHLGDGRVCVQCRPAA